AICRRASRSAPRPDPRRPLGNSHRRVLVASLRFDSDTSIGYLMTAPLAASTPTRLDPATDYLRSRWDDEVASTMNAVDRLVYRSNLLGADARITNTGGGNTSSKIDTNDPLTGATTRVLWVKGSGGDLRTASRTNFASLYLDQVLALRRLYE